MARKLEVVITGDAKQLDRTLKQASASTEKFGHSLKDLAKIGLAGLGLVGVVDGLTSTVKAAEESQVSMAKLTAAFKSSGVSMKEYSKQVEEAQAAGRKLGFSNIDTQAGLAKLVVATQSGSKAMADLKTAEDLARFKHIDLAAASQMLSQAMTGSARAVKQLGINVIPVTTHLTALKAAHKAAGDAATQQEIATAKLADKQATGAQIIATVTQRLHGQADAYAGTAAGAMARFHAALENIQEEIGTKLLPIMTRWINYLTDHLPQIERFIKNVADKVNSVAQALGGWKPVLEALGAVWLLKFSGMLGPITKLIGAPGTPGTGVAGLRGQLAGLARFGAAGIAIPVWINIGTHFLGSSTKSLVEKLLKFGLPQFIPVTILAKGIQSAVSGGTMSPGQAKSQFIKEAMKNGMTRQEAEQAWRDRSGSPGGKGSSVNAGGRAGATRGVGGGNRGAGGAPPAVINYAGAHRNDSRGGHGTTPKEGFDCSGYLVASYRAAGIEIPHNTVAMYNLGDGQPVPGGYTVHVSAANILPGDAVLWDNGQGGAQPGHVGIYAGGGMCWAYSEGSGAPSKTVNMGYLKIMGIRRWVKLRSAAKGGGAGPGGAGTRSAGTTGAPGWSAPGGGGSKGSKKKPRAAAAAGPFLGGIGSRIADDVTADATYVATSADKMLHQIMAHAAKVAAALRAHAAAVKAALAKARADESQAFQQFASNAMAAFDAISAQWESPAAKQLQAMQAEDAAKAAQQAYADAVAQYGADAPEAQAAARALTEAQLEAQAKAEQDAHDKKVKADRDALEKRLAELQKAAAGAKTRTQVAKIQKEIQKLLAEYGITPDAVQGALDWSAAQTLFVQSMGDLKTSMDNLTAAINGAAGKSGASGPPTSAGNTDRGTNNPSAPPPSPGAGRGGHPPPEGEWWKHYQAGGPIPIIAHGGEYVLRADATRKIGVGALNYMNRTGDLPSFGAGGLLDPTDSSGHNLPLTSAVGSGIPYEIWRRKVAMAKYAKREARIFASRALYNPSMLPTPASRADSTIDDWMSALSTDALFTERLGALKSFIDSGDAYRGGAVSRSWLTYGVPKLKTGGYITRGGIAEVHRGETVTPAGRGMGEVHIYLDGKEITSVVESRLVARGRQGQAITARTP